MTWNTSSFITYKNKISEFSTLSTSTTIGSDIQSNIGAALLGIFYDPSDEQVNTLFTDVIQGSYGISGDKLGSATAPNVWTWIIRELLSQYMIAYANGVTTYDSSVIEIIVGYYIRVYVATQNIDTSLTFESAFMNTTLDTPSQFSLTSDEFSLYASQVASVIGSTCTYNYTEKSSYGLDDIVSLIGYYFDNNCFGVSNTINLAYAMLNFDDLS